MIQRIQSVYLFIITILMILPPCTPIAQLIVPAGGIFEFYSYGVIQIEGQPALKVYYWTLLSINIIAILIPFITIFLYKRRRWQVRLCLIEIILCLFFFALMWYDLNRFANDAEISIMYKIGFILPVISAILGYLALRGVLKDIQLIRSYDRIR